MTLLQGVLGTRAQVENPAVPLTSTSILDWMGGGTVHSGVRVSETSSLGMSAVWRAVNLIAGTAASLPLHAYRQVDDTRQTVTSGQAAKLLDKPHPDMTPFEMWEMVYAHIALWGNAYLWIGRNQLGQIAELWPIHPGRVKVGRESEQGRKIYAVDGGEREHTDKTILHIPGFGYDGICGVSPVRVARQGIGLALAAEEYGAKLFGSGSLASGILQTEQRLDQTQANALQKRWKERAAGISNAHEVVVLDHGAKFEQLTIPPEDAQFIESRRFQITEAGRMFGVPPFLMFETEKSTSWGTGLEQQAIGWVTYDLRRWLIRVEQRLTALLSPQAVYARYNVEGLLRGDSAQRAAFYTQMWNIGAYSTDEIRAYEDMGPVDGGDVRYRPLNMGILGETDTEEVPANAAP